MDELLTIAETLRDKMAALSDEQRVVIMGVFTDAYCLHCGSPDGHRCHCEDDE